MKSVYVNPDAPSRAGIGHHPRTSDDFTLPVANTGAPFSSVLPTAQCSRGIIQSRPFPARTLKVMESAGQHNAKGGAGPRTDCERVGVATTSQTASGIISALVRFHRPTTPNRGITTLEHSLLKPLLAGSEQSLPGQSLCVVGLSRKAGGTQQSTSPPRFDFLSAHKRRAAFLEMASAPDR